MTTIKKWITSVGLAATIALPLSATAADYVIDSKGMHTSINFRVSHLGFSFTQGRFNDFEGSFSYDPADINASKVQVTVDTSSIDSNQADRDKHIRSNDFLKVSNFPKAVFTSTKVTDKGDGKLAIDGNLEMLGQTKPITIDATFIGAGQDPWGGQRAGFEGSTRIEFSDFGIQSMAGASYAQMDLYVEGVQKK